MEAGARLACVPCGCRGGVGRSEGRGRWGANTATPCCGSVVPPGQHGDALTNYTFWSLDVDLTFLTSAEWSAVRPSHSW